MTVLHVTGARPNFPKAAPVLEGLRTLGIEQRLVHTGQHYDDEMSDIFFRQLQLPKPDVNLGVGSGSHAHQTAAIMTRIEDLLVEERPALIAVYGDVNSTVAAALVAAKLHIPVAHVEAGLRSFDPTMPEEVNRIVTDRLSDLLFATSPDAVAHLASEGVAASRIHLVGNPMIDTLLRHVDRAPARPGGLDSVPERYVVATLHRPGNVDRAEDLESIVEALSRIAKEAPVLLPVHPRGRARLEASGLFDRDGIHALQPLGYLEFLSLVRGSEAVVTDSGGVQEETTILGIPCFTLRPNTERPITISHGTNRLTTPETVADEVTAQLGAGKPEWWPTPPLWDGHAGRRIADVIVKYLGSESAARS
jgi:UDP-N-acetylglucosamine 2-epimerase (non-hydrolysing)